MANTSVPRMLARPSLWLCPVHQPINPHLAVSLEVTVILAAMFEHVVFCFYSRTRNKRGARAVTPLLTSTKSNTKAGKRLSISPVTQGLDPIMCPLSRFVNFVSGEDGERPLNGQVEYDIGHSPHAHVAGHRVESCWSLAGH